MGIDNNKKPPIINVQALTDTSVEEHCDRVRRDDSLNRPSSIRDAL
jgi:hypothetical protein